MNLISILFIPNTLYKFLASNIFTTASLFYGSKISLNPVWTIEIVGQQPQTMEDVQATAAN